MRDTLIIRSAKAAAAFEHPTSRLIILGLITRARALKELADEADQSLSLLHYHVKRLRALGLIEIASRDRRAGRPIKRYRAVARKFLVPAELTTNAADDALARELRASMERARGGSGAACLYYADDVGQRRMKRINATVRSRSFETWNVLSLSARDAESLGNEIRALFGRYIRTAASPGKRPTLAYCGFAQRDAF